MFLNYLFFLYFRLGPDGTMLGERRHKDELDSGDDSDHGRDQDDVSLGFYYIEAMLQVLCICLRWIL